MNKICIDGVIVVEGKSDVSYLSSFIDSVYFTTNGYDINEEKIDFLKRVSEVRKVIVFTDNDEAGKKIENRIKAEIDSVFTAKSRKITRKNYIKSGVAETEKNEIIETLKPFATEKIEKQKYNLTKLISLSNDPEKIRNDIINEYRLIKGNHKFLEDELNMLKIDVMEFNKKYGN